MRRTFHLSILAAVIALFASAMPVKAEDEIWSALVLASNPTGGAQPSAPPAELAPYTKRLEKLLGFQQYEVLGSASKAVGTGKQERWLVPSPTFLLGAQAQPEGNGYRIQLELYQEKRRLVQTEARLGVQSPLFISGPKHSRGQLIVVFEIRR